MYTALITGATGNVGSACAKLLLDDCLFRVHGISRTILASDSAYHKYEPLNLNMSWDRLRVWCRGNHYKYDLVVMAHGSQKPQTLMDMTEDNWNTIFQSNLSSCIGLTQALVKENKLNSGALIVYCSSIQANTPRSGRGLYAACKSGLEAFSKTVAVELAPMGIRSVALRLGQLTETMGGIQFSPEERAKLESRALLPWIAPQDVAEFIYSLYEQRSMTGCVIDFDSGHGRNVW